MSEQPIDTSRAEAYERSMVPAIFGPWAEKLVTFAGLQAGERVLDVACGTGAVARAAANCVSPSGTVTGIDLDAGMAAVGGALAKSADARIDFHEGNATAMPFQDARFDVVLCQQGLQFLPEPDKGCKEIYRVLAPGGRIGLSLWLPLEHNPGYAAVVKALERRGIDAAPVRRPFSLGNEGRLREMASAAGFNQTECVQTSRVSRFDSPQEFVEILAAGSPSTGKVLIKLGEVGLAEIVHDVAAELADRIDGEGLALPMEAILLLARR